MTAATVTPDGLTPLRRMGLAQAQQIATAAAITAAGIPAPDMLEAEWKADPTLRTTFVGSSEIAAIIGRSNYTTALRLWMEKTGRAEAFTGNHRTRLGQLLEPILMQLWAELWPVPNDDATYIAPKATWRHPDHPHAATSPDGLRIITGPDGRTTRITIGELKTANDRMAHYWDADNAPIEYVSQVVWHIGVLTAALAGTGITVDGELIAQVGWNDPPVRYHIEHQPEAFAYLMDKATEFWRHVEDDTEPPIDATHRETMADLTDLYLGDPGTVADLADHEDDDPGLMAVAANLAALNAAKKAAAKQFDVAKARVCAAAGDATTILAAGEQVATWNITRKLDTERLAKERPAGEVEPYTRTDWTAWAKDNPTTADDYRIPGHRTFRPTTPKADR